MLLTIKMWCCGISILLIDLAIIIDDYYHPPFWLRFVGAAVFFTATLAAIFLPSNRKKHNETIS